MERQPAVADRFYPGDPLQLARTVESLTPETVTERKVAAKAVILPHAGYVYSGATAGMTLSRVRVPETIVILGPNHHGRGAQLAVGTQDWNMPMGPVPIQRELVAQLLQTSSILTADDAAHSFEHSLEVQVPFLQHLRPDIKIVPITVSHVSYAQCQAAAADLASAIDAFSRPVLLVASTDMTHYESRAQATRKDALALERILDLDAEGLYRVVHEKRISMCGVIPATIALLAATQLGAETAELVQYTDSGEASGDTDQVVGYAGLVIG